MMVEPSERVFVDTIGKTEAEKVLRGAANLPPDGRLCDHAMKVMDICDYAAMDIAFVGSWSSVRSASGIPKSNRVWARAVTDIKA